MSIEVTRFPKGIAARNEEEMLDKSRDEIASGRVFPEILPVGIHEIDCFPVDNAPHTIKIEADEDGTGVIRFIPRSLTGIVMRNGDSPRAGGKHFALRNGASLAIGNPERPPSTRQIVYAYVQHTPGTPPPNN